MPRSQQSWRKRGDGSPPVFNNSHFTEGFLCVGVIFICGNSYEPIICSKKKPVAGIHPELCPELIPAASSITGTTIDTEFCWTKSGSVIGWLP